MTTQETAGAARWPVVETAGERGQAIKRRRIALGIDSVSEFVRMTKRGGARGASYDAITAAEKGEASDNTYAKLETFLDRYEEEAGFAPGENLSAAEAELAAPHVEDVPTVEFHIDAIGVTVKGPVADLDKLREAVEKLIRGNP